MTAKIEPVVLLLTALLIFFVGALFLAEWLFKSDGQFYQTVSGLANNISGALLLRITGNVIGKKLNGNGGASDTGSDQTTGK